jgi:CRISPR/Cas system-associated exonuclease Cas4 (RecB family)
MLSTKNHHSRDDCIQFEEIGHIYTINKETNYTSVTSIIKSLFHEFDADEIATKIINSPSMNNPSYKYYGQTVENMKQQWIDNAKDASEKGTKVHAYIENYYNNIFSTEENQEINNFKEFVKDHPHLIAYRTEWMVYYEELRLCGSIDMVFYNTCTHSYEIYDWKRVRDISFESRKTSVIPCINNIPDSNFFHYSIQLHLYKMILEKKYDMKITSMFLINIHPDLHTYLKITIDDMTKEIEKIIHWRTTSLSISS